MDVSLMRKEEPPHGRDQIVETLFGLFSRGGFDGVALSDISEATGLGKSSLYHHFPGGKDDMAAAVVSFASGWLAEHVLAPLKAGKTLSARLDGMLKGVNELYDGGTKPCLIATMLVGHREDSLGRSLSRIFVQWRHAERCARAGGRGHCPHRRRAHPGPCAERQVALCPHAQGSEGDADGRSLIVGGRGSVEGLPASAFVIASKRLNNSSTLR
jgi:TetR/AcrR family transcriptional regulator, lmrAB and yxaGH operons repressor